MIIKKAIKNLLFIPTNDFYITQLFNGNYNKLLPAIIEKLSTLLFLQRGRTAGECTIEVTESVSARTQDTVHTVTEVTEDTVVMAAMVTTDTEVTDHVTIHMMLKVGVYIHF